MNAQFICPNVAGAAGQATGVTIDDRVRIDRLDLGYRAHLQFICGRTITQLLHRSYLLLEDGTRVMLKGMPALRVPSRMFDVPYRLTDLVFSKEEETA